MLLAALLLGCSAVSTAEGPTATTDTAAPTARLFGSVAGPAGEPLGDLVLQACSQFACYPALTELDGGFELPALPLGDWTLKLASSTEGHSPAVVPLRVHADRELHLVVPLLEPEVAIPAQSEVLSVAEGLVLTLSDVLVPGVDAVAAAPIEAGAFPPLDGLVGTPVAGFHLAPLGAGEQVPFTVSAPGAAVAWCTAGDAQGWVRCDDLSGGMAGELSGLLPHFGTLILTDG